MTDHTEDIKRSLYLLEGTKVKEEPKQDVPVILEQALEFANIIKETGLERLTLLFNDRSHAEIVMENVDVLRKKMADQDYHVSMQIAEAFGSLFEKVESSRYEYSGLNENQVAIFKNKATSLYESFNPSSNNKSNNELLLENVNKIVERWEMYSETDNDEEKTFAEGVEYGLSIAANELRTVIERFSTEGNQSGEKTIC